MRQRSKRSKPVAITDESIPIWTLESFLDQKAGLISGISMISTDNVDLVDSGNSYGQLSAAYDFDVSPSLPTIKFGKLVIINDIELLEQIKLEIENSGMSNKPINIDYRIKVNRHPHIQSYMKITAKVVRILQSFTSYKN